MRATTPNTPVPSSKRVLLAVLLGTALATTLGLPAAVPAQAHDVLLRTEPADGQVLPAPPAQVRLIFAEQALSIGTRIRVSGPGGEVVTQPVQVVGSNVTQPLPAGLPAGSYTVLWRVTSADGHPVSGRFSFRADGSGPSTAGGPLFTTSAAAGTGPTGTSAGPTAGGPGGVNVALLIGLLGGVVVVAGITVGAALGLTRTREHRRPRR